MPWIVIGLALTVPLAGIAYIRREELRRDKIVPILFSLRPINLFFYIGFPAVFTVLYVFRATDTQPISFLRAGLALAFTGVAAVEDARVRLVSNRLLLWMLGAWAFTILPSMFLNAQEALSQALMSMLGMILGGGIFLLVYWFSKRGLGGGDVKLAAVLGLYMTIYRILSVLLYGSLLAALIGIILILIKKIDRKSGIPLVPFLFAGLIITVLWM